MGRTFLVTFLDHLLLYQIRWLIWLNTMNFALSGYQVCGAAWSVNNTVCMLCITISVLELLQFISSLTWETISVYSWVACRSRFLMEGIICISKLISLDFWSPSAPRTALSESPENQIWGTTAEFPRLQIDLTEGCLLSPEFAFAYCGIYCDQSVSKSQMPDFLRSSLTKSSDWW